MTTIHGATTDFALQVANAIRGGKPHFAESLAKLQGECWNDACNRSLGKETTMPSCRHTPRSNPMTLRTSRRLTELAERVRRALATARRFPIIYEA